MQVTKNITLDLLETGSPVIIKAKQNDRNTRYIAAHLYVGRLDYQVPSGTEIAFRYKKPDGTAGFYDALPDNSPAITVSGNTVTVELVEQVLTAAGCVHCEINMYNAASEKLTTFTFEISVEESVLTDAEIISSDYYNVLTEQISKALQAVTDATEQAENAAQSAQDAADSAAMSKDWAAGQPVTYSGTPVSIAYAGAQRIASITAYGETPQGGTTEAPVALTGVDEVLVAGNNLCPKGILKTITREGVTFTHNPDGSVSVQGTASKNADYYYFGQYNMPNSNSVKLGTGKYTLSGCPSNIILYLIDIEKIIASQLNSTPVVFTKPLMEITCVLIRVPEGKTVNETVYPMLNIGATALPYEPYNGSITPLPIPRPLRRVGDVRDVCVTRQEHEGAEKLVVTYNVGFVELDVTENVMFQDYGNFKRLFLDLNSSALSRYSLEFSHGEVGAIPTIAGGLAASFNEANLYRLQILGAPDTWTTLGVTDTTTAKTWLAAQKAAGTPVQIAYQLATPEVYATDPLDIDNAAGPLTVMTGGELEVRMTELIGTRSPELTGKMDKATYDADGDGVVDEAAAAPWSGITGKPDTFPPSTHNHDDRYYTETETDDKLAGKANSSHTHGMGDISGVLPSTKGGTGANKSVLAISSAIVTTESQGYANVNISTNATICAVVSQGSATGQCYSISVIDPQTGLFSIQVKDYNGNVVANKTLRVNYIAYSI